jgi:YgiT-type zinc finger domain-containing protein
MVKERCPLCGGEKKDGYTIYTVDLGFGIVILKDVPAKVCSQCGEVWIVDDVASNLEKIVELARKNRLQLELISFSEVESIKV